MFTDAELRAAGVFDCPPERRRSLSSKAPYKKAPVRDLFSDVAETKAEDAVKDSDEDESEGG